MLSFFQKFRSFVSSPTHSRTMGLLLLLALGGAAALTLVASQNQQQIRQRASYESVCAENTLADMPICPPITADNFVDCQLSQADSSGNCRTSDNTIYHCQTQ